MNNNPKVSVIVINYNGTVWIRKCLDSLLAQTYQNIQVVVVDNDSKDDSNDIIKKEYPTVLLHEMGKNTGFATAVNKGVELSEGEQILLFNLDAWIDPTMVENLLKEKVEKGLDVSAPLEYTYEKEKQHENYSTMIDPFGHTVVGEGIRQFYLTGACILFEKEMYNRTHGLDEGFFMYMEEVDWFWRLHLQGKKIAYSTSEKIYHKGAGTTGAGIKYNTFLWRNQNTLQMLLKNYRWYNLLWVLPIYLTINIVEMIFFLILGKPKISLSYLQGLWFNVIHLPRTLNSRKLVQSERKTSDLYVMSNMYRGFGKADHLLKFYKHK
jgi:GT2 family glycosyltransferase